MTYALQFYAPLDKKACSLAREMFRIVLVDPLGRFSSFTENTHGCFEILPVESRDSILRDQSGFCVKLRFLRNFEGIT